MCRGMAGSQPPMMAPATHAPQPLPWARRCPQGGTCRDGRDEAPSETHACRAVPCDKHPGRVESGALSGSVRGDLGLKRGRAVYAGEGPLGFRNRNFNAAQGAAFKIIWAAASVRSTCSAVNQAHVCVEGCVCVCTRNNFRGVIVTFTVCLLPFNVH